MSHESIYAEVQAAIRARKTEEGELGAVARVLAKHGLRGKPQVLQAPARSPEGRNLGVARIYLFENTPAGDFVLVTGPKVDAVIERPTRLKIPGVTKGSVFAQVPDGSASRIRRVGQRFAAHERTAGREPRRKGQRASKASSPPTWISTPGVSAPIGRPLAPLPPLGGGGGVYQPPGLVSIPGGLPAGSRRPRRGGDATSGDWVPAGGLPAASVPEPSDAQRMAMFEQLLAKVLGQVAA